jgi:transcriptional regulator with XRE-family HTH domain
VTPDLAPVQIRLVGALLRHHRETARWTLDEAAAELECDRSKISRIETGHRRPVPREMQQLLAAYGVTDRERQAIAALTETATRAGWWSEYRGLLPDSLVDHAMLESVAGNVMVYEPQALPAFLQAYPYTAAVTAADPMLQTGEERRFAVLLAARRAANIRDQPPAAVSVVIGEAVLMQQVGGREAMLGQLRRIAGETGELPAPVTLQVVPFAAGAHPAIDSGPVSILRFTGVTGIGAICQGRGAAGVLVVRQAELTAAVRRFETLRDVALSPDESLKLIRKVIAAWR